MKSLFSIAVLLLACTALAANHSVHDACKRLCATASDCVHKCVSHAELMEIRPDLVNVAADFHKDPEMRMTALRSGASMETFDLCKKTGWSTENKLICLRSYPTAELIKSCKKLSAAEEDQVRCVRNGKSSAEIDKCSSMLVDTKMRLECLGLEVSAKASDECGSLNQGSRQRLDCLRSADSRRSSKKRVPASQN